MPVYILKTSSRCAKIFPFGLRAVPLPVILVLLELLKSEILYLFWKTELCYGELEYLRGKHFFRL